MKNKPTYTIKKTKGGDYEVTLHNVTKSFMLKEKFMDMYNIKNNLKEVESQVRLNKAVLKNIEDHHQDVVKLFTKMSKLKQTALVNYIDMKYNVIEKAEAKHKDIKRIYNAKAKELSEIHKLLPKDIIKNSK